MGFGQWHSPYKGENWAQSFKFWKFDVLHCSSGLPAPTSSFPRPKIFLRMCLTIALSMAGTNGRSLGTKNWPQSQEKQPKKAKMGQNFDFLKKPKNHFFTIKCVSGSSYRLKLVIHSCKNWFLGFFQKITIFAHFRFFLLIFPDLGGQF